MSDDLPKRRRFRPTPGWLVLGLLVVECLLWLSERFQWFAFSRNRGWTVLIAVASVAAFLLLMLLWFAAGVLFRLPFQFSIRSLLVLTVAVAIPSSWFAVKMREAKQQRKTTDAILKLGGIVEYDYYIDLPVRPAGKPPGPPWLRRLLGPDFLDRVTTVYLRGGDDAELEALQDLPELLVLKNFLLDPSTYWSCKFTDAGLARLETLHRLDTLYLLGANFSDDGLAHLEGLHQLTDLTVGGPQITDAGLAHLDNLQELEDLDLQGDRITDAGLVRLQSLRKLRRLRLHCTISDEGMEHLMSLTSLTELISQGPPDDRVQDRLYEALRQPTQIDLVETPLSDVCEYVGDMHNIKVEIDETALKDTDVDGSCPVTCNIRGVSLRDALDNLVDSVGLAWYVGPRSVVITGKAEYAKRHPNLLRLRQALPQLKKVWVNW
jgi:hypothetical protein